MSSFYSALFFKNLRWNSSWCPPLPKIRWTASGPLPDIPPFKHSWSIRQCCYAWKHVSRLHASQLTFLDVNLESEEVCLGFVAYLHLWYLYISDKINVFSGTFSESKYVHYISMTKIEKQQVKLLGNHYWAEGIDNSFFSFLKRTS